MSMEDSVADTPAESDGIDTTLQPLEGPSSVVALGDVGTLKIPTANDADDLADLDMTALGPDGAQFETAGDLTQLQPADTLLGGEVMDESSDPFKPT
jgi:hypothetical protein